MIKHHAGSMLLRIRAPHQGAYLQPHAALATHQVTCGGSNSKFFIQSLSFVSTHDQVINLDDRISAGMMHSVIVLIELLIGFLARSSPG